MQRFFRSTKGYMLFTLALLSAIFYLFPFSNYSFLSKVISAIPTNPPWQCSTKQRETLIASDLWAGTGPVNGGIRLLFNNPSSYCQIDPSIGSPVMIEPQSSVTSPDKTKYDEFIKDSMIYYPQSGTVQSVLQKKNAVVALVTTWERSSGSPFDADTGLYALYWEWDFGNPPNPANPPKVNLSSVRVMQVLSGTINTVDLTIDNLGIAGAPQNLWAVSQYNATLYKVPWTDFAPQIDDWACQASCHSTPPITSLPLSMGAGSKYAFFKPSLGGGPGLLNGVQVISTGSGTGQVYIAEDIVNQNGGHAVVKVLDANNASTVITTLDTGYNIKTSYIANQYGTYMLGIPVGGACCAQAPIVWTIDGLAQSNAPIAGKYIFAMGFHGRVIWVIDTTTKPVPTLLGVAGLNPAPGEAASGYKGADGIQVDTTTDPTTGTQYSQIYTASHDQEVSSMDMQQVVNAAIANGKGFISPTRINTSYFVEVNTYKPSVSDPVDGGHVEDWDDIVPFNPLFSMPTPFEYDPFYTFNGANIYSELGVTLKSTSTTSPARKGPFSNYALITNNTVQNIPNGSPSALNWSFLDYPSGINKQGLTNWNANYDYNYFLGNLCSTNVNTCTILPLPVGSSTLDNTTPPIPSGVYTFGKSLTINATNGGINADGVILVHGDVTINASHANPFYAKAGQKLLIITDGRVVVNPATPSAGQPKYQNVNLSIITNQDVTFTPYTGSPIILYQPMIFSGTILAYGKGQPTSLNLQFSIGPGNATDPAVQFNYDPAYIAKLSKYFTSGSSSEIGL